MKFTALVETTTVMIVSATSTGAGSTVTPPSGSEKNCTPWKAMIPAAIIWPAALVSQSSSWMSSMAPTRQTMPAPHSTPRSSPVSKTWRRNGRWLAASIAAAKPRKIATPPRRGIGTLCTSRSRTGVKAPVRTAIGAQERCRGIRDDRGHHEDEQILPHLGAPLRPAGLVSGGMPGSG